MEAGREITKAVTADQVPAVCPICFGAHSLFLYQVRGYDIKHCPVCLSDFVWPMPDDPTLRAFYDSADYFQNGETASGYSDYDNQTENVLPFFRGLLERVGSGNGRSVLDIGCAYGTHLALAAKSGWQCYGVEVSAHARRVMRERYGDTIPVVTHVLDLPVRTYDLILLFDVIEHLRDPYKLFLDLAEIGALGSHTKVVVTMPNARSAAALADPAAWVYRTPPEHLVYFSAESLALFFSALGFKRIDISGLHAVDHLGTADRMVTDSYVFLARYAGLCCEATEFHSSSSPLLQTVSVERERMRNDARRLHESPYLDALFRLLGSEVTQRDQVLAAHDRALAEREEQIATLNRAMARREEQIASLNQSLTQRDGQIARLTQTQAELLEALSTRTSENEILQNDLASFANTLEEIRRSTSWRMLAPLRWYGRQRQRVRRVVNALPALLSRTGGLLPLARIVVQVWRHDGTAGVKSLARQQLERIAEVENRHSAATPAPRPDLETAFDPERPAILFVSHEATRTGAPIFFLNLIRFLARRLDITCVILLCSGGELEDKFRELGMTIVLPNQSSLDPRVLDALKKRNLKLVYSNTITNGLIQKRLKELGCPILCHVHELAFSIEHFVGKENLKWVMETTSLYLAACKSVAHYLLVQKSLPADSVALAYPFIDTKENLRTVKNARPPLSLPEDAVVVGACGTIGWRKGTDLFIQLARLVLDNVKKRVVFLWLGGPISHGDYRQSHHDAVMVGVDAYTIFTGSVESPLPYFGQFDIFVLPSREDPFPLVMLDAASLGIPVVCFDQAGGAPEFVEDDAGFVVPYLNIEKMAYAVSGLIENQELRKRMGESARHKALERHDITVGGEHIVAVVKKYL